MTKIFIIGYGNMGQAIGTALVKGGYKVFAYDKHLAKIRGGVKFAGLDDLKIYDAVIIAVKPQDVPNLSGAVRGKINPKSILISIAVGITLKNLARLFGHKKVLRLMPNLGVTVGQGIAAWKSAGLSSADKKSSGRLLSTFTENFEVSREDLINATTAISGSGVAYFFYLAQHMEKAARSLGLSPAQSRRLVEKTLLASSSLQQAGDYAELIERVRSKKGTTNAALKVFLKLSADKIITKAVTAAYNRARKLSRM